MADEQGPDERAPDDAALGAIARHALHDEELIAAFAADGLDDPAESDKARALVARCATCHDLHRDLVGIGTAIRASGTATERASTIRAPRDFRLSADDAARLRPGTPIARGATRLGLRERIRVGVTGFGRPVGAALATFGVAGLLVGSLTLGGAAGSGMTADSVAAPSAPGALENPPGPKTTDQAAYFPRATRVSAESGVELQREAGVASGPWSLLLLGGSAALVVLGTALVLTARRNIAAARQDEGNRSTPDLV